MAREPVLDLPVFFDAILDLPERREAPVEHALLALQRLQALQRFGACGFPPGQIGRQARERLAACGEGGRQPGDLRRDFGESLRLRLREALPLADQPFLPRFELGQGLPRVREMRLLDLEGLLGPRDGGARLGHPRLLVPVGRFEVGELRALGFDPLVRRREAGPRRLLAVHPHGARVGQLGGTPLGFGELRNQRARLRVEPLARLGNETDLGLEPRDLGVGLVEPGLRGVGGVLRLVVPGARLLDGKLDFAQACGFGLELVRRLLDLARVALPFRPCVVLAQEPQEVLLLLDVGLQRLVLGRDFGLARELLDLRVELAADVVDAGEVLARVLEALLGLAAPLLVLRDARRLLEEHAQFLGLRLDDPGDHPLLDDRVGARSDAGAEEDVLDVAPAHDLVVDEVVRLPVALQDALDGNLGVARPLARGLAHRVVEHEFHARAGDGLALRRAVEDDVLHRLAAQRRGPALAEHPPDRVDDVRLAAAVRADHADEIAGNADGGGVDERLEPRELDLGEAQLDRLERPAGTPDSLGKNRAL